MAIRTYGPPSKLTHVIVARFEGRTDYLRYYLNPDDPTRVRAGLSPKPNPIHMSAADAASVQHILHFLGASTPSSEQKSSAASSYQFLSLNAPLTTIAIRAQAVKGAKRKARWRTLLELLNLPADSDLCDATDAKPVNTTGAETTND